MAERAGNTCSFPGCDAPTKGPSREKETATSSTGIACHIIAASDKGPARRVVPDCSIEKRKHISNGIWMCATHGKLIDTDESTYTIEELCTWRDVAVRRAEVSHQLGRHITFDQTRFTDIPLPSVDVERDSTESVPEFIGNRLKASCLHQIWGKAVAREARTFLIEIAENAFVHGKAQHIRLCITPNTVELLDDGQRFDSRTLLKVPGGGGGQRCAKAITNNYYDCVVFESELANGMNRNRIALIHTVEDIKNFTPCIVELSWGDVQKKPSLKLVSEAGCNIVYIILPEYVHPSIIRKSRFVPEPGKEYVIVGSDLSDTTVEMIEETFAEVALINLKSHS